MHTDGVLENFKDIGEDADVPRCIVERKLNLLFCYEEEKVLYSVFATSAPALCVYVPQAPCLVFLKSKTALNKQV